ncbi:hypothetical protein GL267_008180 [Acidithiobacillus ferrianus]|nr:MULTISPECIES: hypothetical protein [Acidithiobacillus]MCK9188557.1 hypothetical protein [Acidithiobacillus sp.]MCR0968810.1 hypothetical protein [Acidithiobacillus ferrooxidans]MCR1341365.1 hypothetical protein [Acidithiobacillus ferrooxidans]MCR1346244.1 hypothetical protein [Acidithiobacillus ferrooxidans]MCR1348073.1 hypothetical protein [Acidithiobacillus ferrooxidans]
MLFIYLLVFLINPERFL